jgi:hypothetical protein
VQAVSKDLAELNFNCAIRSDDDGQWLLLVGMNDHERVLREAENQVCLAPYTPKNQDKFKKSKTKLEQLRAYLDPRVLDAEQRRLFEYE